MFSDNNQPFYKTKAQTNVGKSLHCRIYYEREHIIIGNQDNVRELILLHKGNMESVIVLIHIKYVKFSWGMCCLIIDSLLFGHDHNRVVNLK